MNRTQREIDEVQRKTNEMQRKTNETQSETNRTQIGTALILLVAGFVLGLVAANIL